MDGAPLVSPMNSPEVGNKDESEGDGARTDEIDEATEDVHFPCIIAAAPCATVTVSVSTASQNHTVRVGGTVVKSHVLCILDSIACSNDSLFHHEQENIETS